MTSRHHSNAFSGSQQTSRAVSGAISPTTVISEVRVNVLFPIVITHRKVIPVNFFVSRRIPSNESAGLGRYGR